MSSRPTGEFGRRQNRDAQRRHSKTLFKHTLKIVCSDHSWCMYIPGSTIGIHSEEIKAIRKDLDELQKIVSGTQSLAITNTKAVTANATRADLRLGGQTGKHADDQTSSSLDTPQSLPLNDIAGEPRYGGTISAALLSSDIAQASEFDALTWHFEHESMERSANGDLVPISTSHALPKCHACSLAATPDVCNSLMTNASRISGEDWSEPSILSDHTNHRAYIAPITPPPTPRIFELKVHGVHPSPLHWTKSPK